MNKTAQFTPGPWGVDATGQVCKRAVNGSWDLIAYLDESPYYHNKFANAALIAAAPAMYEALQNGLEIIEYFVREQRKAGIEEDDCIGIGDLRNFKTVLSQAEGR